MDIDKMFSDGNIDGIADNVFGVVNNSVSEVKEMQRKKVAENVQLVVEALKKIESDIRERFDSVGNAIEKRVITIKDGRDGANGSDGKPGKDGKAGRDGAPGVKGADGRNGSDGVDGTDGVSVTNAHIDFDGSLVISLSSGIEVNVGEVVAPELAEQIRIVSSGGGTSQYVLDTLASLQTQINNLIPSQTGNSGKFLTTNGTATSWATVSGSGTVTSVAQSFTGGIVSVAGSPITTSGTLALTVAGTSGGIPYFSSGTTWATSAALAAGGIVVGGGAGVTPATTTTGTGVVTALGVNTGSAGAMVLFNGALGTPSSGNVTNLTGTASININGTVGATTPAAATVTTLSASSTTTLSALTASTALALDASKNIVSVTNTGSGSNVLATSPTLVTPALGTPSAIVLTNASGTASININGTVGATTAATGAFTSLSSTIGANFATSSGNVGIGTSSPSAKLHSYATSGTTTTLGKFEAAIGSYTGTSLIAANTLNASSTYNLFSCITDSDGDSGGPFTQFLVRGDGNVGIGTSSPSYQLQVNTDSAGKPGVGGLWTVVSDERIKSDIVPANLDRCYEIVKSVPLKYFGFAPGVYTDDQINDKHNLGWIAQDVQKVFKNAVSVKPFTLKTDIPDGVDEYEEQDFTIDAVEKTEISIQVINGKPVQVSKVVTSENKVVLFDTVDVLDEAGVAVMDGDKPLTYQMPRMITKTRPKVRHDVIEDCLDLNGGQMIAALYGCVQALMAKVEALEAK